MKTSSLTATAAAAAALMLLLVPHYGAMGAAAAQDGLVLNKKLMELSKTAAELSLLAYEENPPHDAYAYFSYFDAEPDQALVARKDGYCFAAFRGTTLTLNDWEQNIVTGTEQVCDTHNGKNGNNDDCCTTRRGFYQAYNTVYEKDLERAVRKCAAETCHNKDECVVLTGHSQGGAIAAVAALYMPDLNPYVITFGQPPTIAPPCPLITTSRWYRFVNTKAAEKYRFGIVYDPVPFSPGLGAVSFGHMIILSEDDTGVAYIGLDANTFFGPLNLAGFEAHSMLSVNGTYPGYLDRIEAIMAKYNKDVSYPVRASGFVPGSLCTKDQECELGQCAAETGFSYKRCVGTDCQTDEDCKDSTEHCDSGLCMPKLGSCQECDENSDCLHGVCSWAFRCSGKGGLMDDQCACILNSDCRSGRCEGFTKSICEATLADGARCDESSDCQSGYCTWRFLCAPSSKSLLLGKSHDVVSDKENQDASTIDANTVEEKKGKMGMGKVGIFTACGVAVLAMFFVALFRLRNHRRGYERIPAQLEV